MNIAIVDDNKTDIQKLKEFIGIFYENSLVFTSIKTYDSGEDYLSLSAIKDIDVIFLDIFMNELSGIDVAKKVREVNSKCMIVFVSTSNNFAAESYLVNALEYMIKPYDYIEFAQIMQKVNDKAKKNSCYFDLKQRNKVKRILLSKIIYVDYYNHYVQIHTNDEVISSYVVTFPEVSSTLLQYKNFICCFRNLLVNMDKVAKLEGKNFIMTNSENIPITREKVKAVREQYHSYLFSKIEGDV